MLLCMPLGKARPLDDASLAGIGTAGDTLNSALVCLWTPCAVCCPPRTVFLLPVCLPSVLSDGLVRGHAAAEYRRPELSGTTRRSIRWLLGGTYYRTLPRAYHPQPPDVRLRKSVVSLFVEDDEATDTPDGKLLVGTAFAVTVDAGECEAFNYLVSTREVVRRSIKFNRIYVRYLLADGGYVDTPTIPYDDWYPHPDPRSDIAVHPMTETPADVQLQPVPLSMLTSDKEAKSLGVGPGDRLLSVGQFQPHPERSGPRPVISHGSVYLMPQLVATRVLGPDSTPMEVEGYLTEWRAWGGGAGSPVFRRSPQGDTVLLGMVHSHVHTDDPEAMGEALLDGQLNEEFGIAVVVPAQRVREVLEAGPIAEAREQAAKTRMIEKIKHQRDEAIDALALA
jgi:hypothetical protein